MAMKPEIVLQTPCPAQVACVCSTEVTLGSPLEIPAEKLDVEEIREFRIETAVTDWRVIPTTQGQKVIASGSIRFNIQYVAAVPAQSVHFAHFELPWDTFFVCGDDITTDICNVTVCVEFADYTMTDPRHLATSAILFLCATACPPPNCPPCP